MRRFLVVDGLIGVGKTTLCRLLEAERGAELVLEPHEDNPFLEPFYREPQRYALPVQMYFLLTRFRQQDQVRQLSLFNDWVVADYLFEKDRLFAEKTLHADELELYDRIATSLGARVPVPDLVVALHAPVPVLLERIRQRGIKGEDRIDRRYLEDLSRRYDRLWARWDRCPVLHVDTADLEYHRDASARAAVLARIDAALAGPSAGAAPAGDGDRWPDLFAGRDPGTSGGGEGNP